jgi:hypothetical protein
MASPDLRASRRAHVPKEHGQLRPGSTATRPIKAATYLSRTTISSFCACGSTPSRARDLAEAIPCTKEQTVSACLLPFGLFAAISCTYAFGQQPPARQRRRRSLQSDFEYSTDQRHGGGSDPWQHAFKHGAVLSASLALKVKGGSAHMFQRLAGWPHRSIMSLLRTHQRSPAYGRHLPSRISASLGPLP